MSSIMGTTDFDALYKTNFQYSTQLFLFYGQKRNVSLV
jgi:NADH-ubiquinone oxidoreductase chain 4